MYKHYKKGDYDIMEYDFDSITAFLDYIDSAPINSEIWGYRRLESETENYDFCKTHSLEEAKELCKYGYHDNFEKLVELKNTLEKYIKLSRKQSRQYNFYVGYAPDVKAYLEGSPLSMLNRQYPKLKHIDVYFNAANIASVSSNMIFNRGAITLCIVEILENMGFSVDFNFFTMASKNDQVHYVKLNLKRSGERLNIQKSFFPLAHPSFLRRLIFRLMEQTPDITMAWTSGYGITCDDYTIREVISLAENDIVICRPDEMGVQGYDIIDDANAMFDYINKFTNESIKLEHVKNLKR